LPDDLRYAYQVRRGHGIDGQKDGLIIHNLLASYTHLRSIGQCYWASRFLAFIRTVQANQQAA
jgi:cobyrinic acid a,c-diamide synthase